MEAKAALFSQKYKYNPDLLSRSRNYRVNVEKLQKCKLLTSLLIVRQTTSGTSGLLGSEHDLNLNSEAGPVIFETSHLLLSPHSRGLGQQSGYWDLESGKTAQEYVGLFTTLSQLKNKWKHA